MTVKATAQVGQSISADTDTLPRLFYSRSPAGLQAHFPSYPMWEVTAQGVGQKGIAKKIQRLRGGDMRPATHIEVTKGRTGAEAFLSVSLPHFVE